jgi:hypothetical protein
VRELVARRRSAGVVDEDVEAAERLDGPRDHVGGRVRVHEVGGHVEEVAFERFKLGRGAARRGDDARAFVEQGVDDCEADALGCARDNGDAAGEFEVHTPVTHRPRRV